LGVYNNHPSLLCGQANGRDSLIEEDLLIGKQYSKSLRTH
jgi:hypothetical protein